MLRAALAVVERRLGLVPDVRGEVPAAEDERLWTVGETDDERQQSDDETGGEEPPDRESGPYRPRAGSASETTSGAARAPPAAYSPAVESPDSENPETSSRSVRRLTSVTPPTG